MFEDVLFYQNYVMVGDIIAFMLCLVVAFLIRSTYTVKRTNLRIFKTANRLVAMAAASSIIYHTLIDSITTSNVPLIYFFRIAVYTYLIWIYVCFCIYIRNLVEIEQKYKNIVRVAIYGVASVYTVLQILSPFLKVGFYIDENLQIHQNYYFDFFRFAYVYYTIFIAVLMHKYKKRIIKKMLVCIWKIMGLSFGIMAYQAVFLSTTYTVVSFAFPIIAILFLFHHNAYEIDTGTLDQYSFDEFLEDSKEKRYSLIVLSLPEISHEGMRKLSKGFLRKNYIYFKDSYCFRLRNNRIVLAYQKGKNEDYKVILERIFRDFTIVNMHDKNDYRVLLIDDTNEFLHSTEFLYFCEYFEGQLPLNAIKKCKKQDIKQFQDYKVIFQKIRSIYEEEDLNDERVKVYCQPVLNTQTNQFTTAEALMRLELPEIGMLYPDQFIPTLESQGFMHVFSKIILNKTCKEIKRLEEEGYCVERISVNFSVQELQLESFCDDIVKIIRENGIEFHKIAIELTETRNEKDFMMMKHVLESLQQYGIKFYLDDFGTGYSNFERIIELPVDTIKFDRSLTILASKDEESKFMVGSFSEIFKRANYQILFEGVEDEKDELHCKDMNAQFLQGYKYSKPIPIEQLNQFLEKND